MKKVITILSLMLLVTSFTYSQIISIVADNVTAFNGDSVSVSVNVSNFLNVGAITIKIQIDTTALEFNKAINWHSSMSGGLSGQKGNIIILAWDGVNGANISSGKMLDLRFKYLSGNGSIAFLSGSSEIADINGNVLTVNYTNGSVTQTPPPANPKLISPANGALDQPVNLRLDWDDVINAMSYQIQISTDYNFSNIILDRTNITETYTDIYNLINEKDYYWRVNASNPTGTSGWSDMWTFRTIVRIPDQPVLISPANGSIDQPASIFFKWNRVDKATGYIFQLSSDSLFNSSDYLDSLLTDTLKSINNLQYNKKYFWRVKAKNINGSGIWSSVWNFSTIYKYNVSGTLKYANAQKSPMKNVKVYLTKGSVIDSVITNNDGSYNFTGIINGNYSLTAKTDKIWDGVNSTDALLIRRYAAGLTPFTNIQLQSADVNLSGNINSTDAFDIRRRIVFIINSFPKGDWCFEEVNLTVNNSSIIRDFEGIVTGDINGSYDISLLKNNLDYSLSSNGNLIKAKKNDEIDFPLCFTESIELGAITLEILYPVEDFEFVGINFNLSDAMYFEKNGKILILWDDVQGKRFTKNESLLSLRLKAKDEVFGSKIILGDKTEFANIEGKVLDKFVLTAPEFEPEIPMSFKLQQNYPNPFNPATRIDYEIPENGFVQLRIYNPLGELVSQILNEYKNAGHYVVNFNPEQLSSGIYFYKLNFQGVNVQYSKTKKMVYQK